MKETQPFDARAFRDALGTFLTGVTVVTMRSSHGAAIGITANSFTSVSLDPPLVLVCVGSGSSNFAAFAETDHYAINILDASQGGLAGQFARRGADRFAGIGHGPAKTGAPVLEDALAWFDCTLFQRVVAGDHLVLIGRVEAFGARAGAPLGFHRGRYVRTEAAEVPVAQAEPTVTAVLVEHAGRLLLQRTGTDGWTLPTSRRPRNGSHDYAGALSRRIASGSTFIYSVYEDKDDGYGYLVYRATLSPETDPTTLETEGTRMWVAIDDLPWTGLRPPLAALLKRYGRERRDGRFGVYIDSADGGHVALVQDPPFAWSTLTG